MDRIKIMLIVIVALVLLTVSMPLSFGDDISWSDHDAVKIDGYITVHVFNGSRLKLIYPVMGLSKSQTVQVFGKRDGAYYNISTVLRIHVDTSLSEGCKTILGRYLKAFISIARNDGRSSLFPKGGIGKIVNRYRVNILERNGTVCLDVPFVFRTTSSSMNMTLRVLTWGSVPGALLRTHRVFAYEKISLHCVFSEGVDVTPPVTSCVVNGTMVPSLSWGN